MMGFQNVYSPTTGEHWEASYSDYNATGPDGPGYYRKVGSVGGYEKLSEGYSSKGYLIEYLTYYRRQARAWRNAGN